MTSIRKIAFECFVAAGVLTGTGLGPGNVAAFYFNLPIETSRAARFYRSAYIAPSF